jgi:hypothetical protein
MIIFNAKLPWLCRAVLVGVTIVLIVQSSTGQSFHRLYVKNSRF